MLRRLLRDRRGAAAVEFAMISPILIMLYLGLAETTMGLMADRRSSRVASTVGDLVAQTSMTSPTELTDIYAVAGMMMKPFPSSALNIRVTSIKADAAGVAKVAWSNAQGTGLPKYAVGTTMTPPTGMLPANQSLILAEVRYNYNAPVASTLPRAIVFNDRFYLRPRNGGEVTCPAC